MVVGLLIILGFQLIGELIVVGMGLPLPGPVLGMVLLVLAFVMFQQVPEGLRHVSDGLLSNLALLFVPAGVGLILHFELLATEWWIILLALIISSLVAAVVTAVVFQWVKDRGEAND